MTKGKAVNRKNKKIIEESGNEFCGTYLKWPLFLAKESSTIELSYF